ncbi:unnamed protein product, partial [Meganyctiphanes norvegica]
SGSPPESISESEELVSPASSTCCSSGGTWGAQETGFKTTHQGIASNGASSPETESTIPPCTNNCNNDSLFISSIPGPKMPISKSVPNLKGFLHHSNKNHK